jgi:hypothetical protein
VPGDVHLACLLLSRSIAAFLLHAAGPTGTAVDDDFGRAAGAGLPVTGPAGRTSAAALARARAAVTPGA